MKRLAILGAGGHGKVVADAAILAGFDEIIFFDARWNKQNVHMGFQVVGSEQEILGGKFSFDAAVIAIGDNSIRARWGSRFREYSLPMATIIHPAAVISRSASIGPGSVVFAGAIVNASAVLGEGCILNVASTVDHDCQLGHYVHVASGANIAGEVNIGRESLIGVGAAVRPLTAIGSGVTIGAGAVVIRSVDDGLVVAGNPARELGH